MTAPLPDQTGRSTEEAPLRTTGQVEWPERYSPAHAVLHVQNEIVIAALPEDIWPWLLRAELWPSWYPNAQNIHFISHAGPDLRDRSRFRWSKFGLPITSKVGEFVPFERLAWDAQGPGLEGWHAWLLVPLAEVDGQPRTRVITEETQSGWLARLGKFLMPSRIHTQHQVWLERLGVQAISSRAVAA